jgi:hypothetical protein
VVPPVIKAHLPFKRFMVSLAFPNGFASSNSAAERI